LRIRKSRVLAVLVSSAGLVLAGITAAAAGPARPGGSPVTVTSPGPQSGQVGQAVSLAIGAADAASRPLTFHATGLPGGLSIGTAGGVISGKPTPSSTGTSSVTVVAVDSAGASDSVSFRWTVSPAAGCPSSQLIGNPGFETGLIDPWQGSQGVLASASAGVPAHSGRWLAWLGGYTTPHTDSISQDVTIPAACSTATLTFWLQIASNVPRSQAVDAFRVQVLGSDGSVASNLDSYTNQATSRDYQRHTYDLSRYTGQQITIRFTGRETNSGGHVTSFYLDDATLNVS
jgi:hypothetical protein